MTTIQIAASILFIGLIYFIICQSSARHLQVSISGRLHSRTQYYGFFAALMAWLPAYALLIVMAVGDDIVFQSLSLNFIPDEVQTDPDFNEIIAQAQIKNLVSGTNFGKQPDWAHAAADAWQRWIVTSARLTTVVCLSLALLGGFLGYYKVNPNFRSRNAVEGIVISLLAASSVIAILTTMNCPYLREC